MLRRLAFLLLFGVCSYQQWRIHEQQALVRDLINGLQRDAEVLNNVVWDIPPPPDLPREWALSAIEHPQEQ